MLLISVQKSNIFVIRLGYINVYKSDRKKNIKNPTI